jgi:hypothetical protein
MASPRQMHGRWVVVAETDEERAMLEAALAGDERIVLREGYYRVTEGVVLLPTDINEAGAWNVAKSFSGAARRDAKARAIRARFRVID